MAELNCWTVMTRKKSLPAIGSMANAAGSTANLGRVLNTFDLTALGVGATLGVGVYVLAGHVSRDLAGPSVVLSFLIAAVASFMAGLCYAEFGARVPKAGSAYYYSYVCIGELVAFITGWNLILQYIIGSASISRGLSLYLDTIFNDTLKETFREIAPINSSAFASYFDFLALGLPILLAVALAFGLKKSAITNNIFTAVNIAIVLFVIICGSLKADIANWHILPSNATAHLNVGDGGFFPFGIEGMLKGAATCFFGFVGFDCIATTGEEVKNPHKAIPKAILFSLIIIFLSYFGVSTVLTLIWPYYLQDINAPLPYAFDQIGWVAAKWVVAIGGIIGLITSLFGAMFPLPRIIYAMSTDGLIFKFLGRVNEKFKTPVVGTLVAGLVTGLVAAIFDLKQLVNMLSIGTLLAYTVVAISITILRYSDHNEPYIEIQSSEHRVKAKRSGVMHQLFSCSNKPSRPNKSSKKIVTVAIFLFSILSLTLALLILHSNVQLITGQLWAIITWSGLVALLLLLLALIALQPKEIGDSRIFRVPLVPLIPAISIFVNIYLMLMLDMYTWIFFAVWLVIEAPPVQETRNSFKSLVLDPNNNNNKNNNSNANGTLPLKSERTVKEAIPVAPPVVPAGYDDDKQPRIPEELREVMKIVAVAEETKQQSVYDEIVPESEVRETHTEKKESNGKAYFIERETSEDNVLQLLDSAIDDNSTDEVVSGDEKNEVRRSDSSIEIVAMVHMSSEEETLPETEDKLESAADTLPAGEDNDSGILVASQISLNERSIPAEGTNDDGFTVPIPPPIPPPLPILSGTKTLPLNRANKKEKPKTPRTIGPSKSETDVRLLLLEEIKQFRQFDQDEVLEKMGFPQNHESPVEAVSPTVTDAPKFSPKVSPVTRPKVTITPLKRLAPSAPIIKPAESSAASSVVAPEKEDINDVTITKKSDEAKLAFRVKLERIYSQGPPVIAPKAPRRQEKPPAITDSEREAVDSEAMSISSTNTEADAQNMDNHLAKVKPTKPFDTVHKQKVLFNDVLKSINPDTRPSVIRNNSFQNKTNS